MVAGLATALPTAPAISATAGQHTSSEDPSHD